MTRLVLLMLLIAGGCQREQVSGGQTGAFTPTPAMRANAARADTAVRAAADEARPAPEPAPAT